ncbi:Arc family DNA-binding protein [Thiofilum flexile]|uniref:Arc family DNA-binding protein n=1 Tax=Thiofilum flexile TaxID=125627 RepID=UPI000365C55B|nr:Arc family DNA-binding protein [Thiofilum flexile]
MNTDIRPQPYSLRLEPEIRERLEAIARASNRSLHAEIMMRLVFTLENPDLLIAANASGSIFTKEQEARLRELINEELAKASKS